MTLEQIQRKNGFAEVLFTVDETDIGAKICYDKKYYTFSIR